MSQETRKTQIDFLRLLNFGGDADMVFLNVHTLRLSKHGRILFEREFEYWTFDSPGTTSGNLIKLSRVMSYPYYIDRKVLVLFTERDAFIAKLGDPQIWLDGKIK